MGMQKQIGNTYRKIRAKERAEVRATDLYKEVDSMLNEIANFYRKNPVILDFAFSNLVHRVHVDYENDELTMDQSKEEAKMRAMKKIDDLHEARLARRKIQAIKEEHAILSKSKLWPK